MDAHEEGFSVMHVFCVRAIGRRFCMHDERWFSKVTILHAGVHDENAHSFSQDENREALSGHLSASTNT